MNTNKHKYFFYLCLSLAACCLLLATFSVPARAADSMELLRKGQYKEAFEALSSEIEENPKNVELRIQLAELYIMFGKHDVARKVLEDAMELEPGNPTIYTDLGIVYEQSGEPSKALLEQLRAVELSPDHPTAFNNLGHTYITLGMPRKAGESFKKSILVNTASLLNLKSKLGLLPRWNDSPPSLNMEQASALTFYLENIAYAYMGMDNRGKALETLREALELDPENEILKQKINEIESRESGLPDKIPEAPLDGDEIIEREKAARKLLLNGNVADSGALLENMLSRGVESASIRTAHGIVLQAIGDVEGAAEEYHRALELDPGHLPALANLGFVSEYQGLFDKSIEYYSRALKIEPDNAMIHNNLGHSYEMSGNYEKALAEYNKALELDPGLGVAVQNIAGLYLTQDLLDKALEALGAALTLGPPSPAIYNNLAFIHNKQFNADDARRKLKEGLELHPGHKILERNLAFLSETPGATAVKQPKTTRPAPALAPVEISFARGELSDTPRGIKAPLPEPNESQVPEASELQNPLLSTDSFPEDWKKNREKIKGRFMLESSEGKIWLAEPSTKLAEFVAEGKQPAISSDGGRAAMVRRAERNLEIRTLSLESGEEKSITTTPEFKKGLSFSGDGAMLAYLSSENLFTNDKVWIYSFKEAKERLVSEIGNVVTYAWAPGSHRIVVLTSECPDQPDGENASCLAEIDVDTGSVVWIKPEFVIQGGGAEIDLRHKRVVSIAVSPDRGEILIVADNDPGVLLAVNPGAGTARYIKVNKPDGDAPIAQFAAWSPDGKDIAFTHRGDIWTVDSGGGAAYPAVWGYVISGRFTWIQP